MTKKSNQRPIAIVAAETAPRTKPSTYPESFFSPISGHEKRMLGDQFDHQDFGVSQTTLAPGCEFSLMYKHTKQDEFIYILAGALTSVTADG